MKRSTTHGKGKAPNGGDRSQVQTSLSSVPDANAMPQAIIQTQHFAGNRAVGKVLGDLLQPKLRVGPAGDKYEREADRMADAVLGMAAPGSGDQGAPIGQVSGAPIQRVCTECDEELRRQPMEEEEEELVQREASGGQSGGEASRGVSAQVAALRGRGQPLAPSFRSFFEPRFNHDFGNVRVHTGSTAAASAQAIKARAFTVGRDIAFNAGEYAPHSRSGRHLLAHELTHVVQQTPLVARRAPMIQRQAEPAAQTEAPTASPEQGQTEAPVAPVEDREATPEPAPQAQQASAPGLLVEDGETEVGAGRMTKSAFLTELRTGICDAADAELAGTAFSAQGCPTIELYLRHYDNLSAARIEQDLINYVPEAAGVTDARQYIPLAAARVQRSVASWVQTGEITGVPEGLPTGLPGLSALAGLLFKARPGGPRGNANPIAVQAQLGAGRPLNSTVSSRMGSAFGRSFSNVRVHTDSTARRLNNQHNARAFTVGNHVVFGVGEYQPGTVIGDALIAHELAHTVQQRNSDPTVAQLEARTSAPNSLERDADRSAIAVMASLWGGGQAGVRSVARNAIPRLRSGVRLARCGGPAQKPTQVPSAGPAESPPQASPAGNPPQPSNGSKSESVGEKKTIASCATPADHAAIINLRKKAKVKNPTPVGTIAYGFTFWSPKTAVTRPKVAIDWEKADSQFIGKVKTTSTSIGTIEALHLKPDTYKIPGKKVTANFPQCGSTGKKVPFFSTVSKAMSDLSRAAEQEHCDDYKQAFELTYGKRASIINSIAGTTFGPGSKSQVEAKINRALKDAGDKSKTAWSKEVNRLTALSAANRDAKGWHSLKPDGPPVSADAGCTRLDGHTIKNSKTKVPGPLSKDLIK